MNVHGIVLMGDLLAPYNTIDVGGLENIGHFIARGEVWSSDRDRNNLDSILGRILDAKIVLTSNDCRSDSDRALLDVARGQPFVRASVEIYKSKADLVAVLLKGLRWSAWGTALEKTDDPVARHMHVHRYALHGINVEAARLHEVSPYRLFPGLG
jgi:hypothetical protein